MNAPFARRMPARQAREAAFQILEQWSPEGRFASDLLDEFFEHTSFSVQERRLTQQLVYGVIRRRLTLHAFIRQLVHRPLDQIEPGLEVVLSLGLFQLTLCSGIPVHAAVHETVELARKINMRWTGFVNGVLRGVQKILTDETTDRPSPRSLPVSPGVYRLLSEDLFTDPETHFLEYASEAFSFPAWQIESWQALMSRDDLLKTLFWFNEAPPVYLRVNQVLQDRESYARLLTMQGYANRPGPLPESLELLAAAPIPTLPGFQEGWFAVQDLTAMEAARRLKPQPGESVLDLCAAPGSKTCHLAELMNNRGSVLGTDTNPGRLAQVRQNRDRLKLTIVDTEQISPQAADIPGKTFDAVLADVPCSNTGVLGKRPEARWRLQPRDLRELSDIQAGLLRLAGRVVRPGGRLLYSTCSIERAENEEQVQKFLQANPDYRLVEEARFRPGQPADGGYQALLVRRG